MKRRIGKDLLFSKKIRFPTDIVTLTFNSALAKGARMCHSFLGAWVTSHRLTSFGIFGGIMALLDPS